jgi:hypothetical protein
MPGGDGAGPAGAGPMTGRAAGYCAGYPVPGFMNPVARVGRGFYGAAFGGYPGYGRAMPFAGAHRGRFGLGFGRGWAGPRGFGLGRGFGGGRARGRRW